MGHQRPLSITEMTPFSYVTTTTTWSLSWNSFSSLLCACPWTKTLVGRLPAIQPVMSRSCIVESLKIPPERIKVHSVYNTMSFQEVTERRTNETSRNQGTIQVRPLRMW